MVLTLELKNGITQLLKASRKDWCVFASQILNVNLDDEQKQILRSVQQSKMNSVASGTARGKDFVAAVAAMCFLYTTPVFEDGKLIANTKIACTAPTDRQVRDIMMPELARLHRRMVANGFGFLAGNLNSYAIRTEYEEWFLVGFKADEHNHEAWSGFHAANTMFVVTEASGISESVFNAIEGNLQGNSRILIVFNPNIPTGYAAASQKSPRWHKFRLDSLNAPNVLQRNNAIPGQVDYDWVNDKVKTWCTIIPESDFIEDEGDFKWSNEEGTFFYRPNDLFRVKVRGMFPKVSSDVLIPLHWIEAAQKRYKEYKEQGWRNDAQLRLGVDVAGMGRDSSAFCPRFGDLVEPFEMIQSGGTANHMQVAGKVKTMLATYTDKWKGTIAQAFIDTIGEGAGVYSRLVELSEEKGGEWLKDKVHSVKFSIRDFTEHFGIELKDATGQYSFENLRAYCYWCIRDWLNPALNSKAMLPEDDELTQDLTETKWEFTSNGKIKIEPKEEIKKRLGHSPDKGDGLANTFYPAEDLSVKNGATKPNYAGYF